MFRTPSEEAQIRANEAAHYGRIADSADRISALKALLAETDKTTVLTALKEGGYLKDDSLDEEELPTIKAQIQEKLIAPMEKENNRVAGYVIAVKKDIVRVGEPIAPVESTEQLDERLKPLVVDAVNALPEGKRVVRGKIRTGEEVARAIPDVEAFLAEVALMQEGTFFELNERGQLVMKDGVKEAYGLGENALQARIRQTRVVYKDAEGHTQVMMGEQYFKVTKRDARGNPLEMELTEEAKKIDPKSILMAKGLPTLTWDGSKHTGEYARMNDKGQFERQTYAWVEDETITDASLARDAYWVDDTRLVNSVVNNAGNRNVYLGSRGVLRVNLNFES